MAGGGLGARVCKSQIWPQILDRPANVWDTSVPPSGPNIGDLRLV